MYSESDLSPLLVNVLTVDYELNPRKMRCIMYRWTEGCQY